MPNFSTASFASSMYSFAASSRSIPTMINVSFISGTRYYTGSLYRESTFLPFQCRMHTKLITGLRDLRYDDRLKECGLTTLETRRLRGDQIEVFKILNGHENIDPNIFFKIKTGKITRGHDFTLVKGQNWLDFRKYSFSQRTVNEWNNCRLIVCILAVLICLRTE